MEFTINVQPAEKIPATSFVLPVFADEPTLLVTHLDKLTKGKLSALLKEETDLDKAGSLHTYTTLPGLDAERLHVVSLGPRAKLDRRAWMKAVRSAAAALANGPVGTAVVSLAEIEVPGTTLTERLRRLATALEDATYTYDATKTTNGKKPRGADRIELPLPTPLTPNELAALEEGRAIAAGMARARELGNLPPNLCTPAKLAETALELGKVYDLKVEVLEREDAERLGMGAFLAVAAGSKTPPKFIVAEYRGSGRNAANAAPSSSSAKASPSIRAVSASSPPPRWTR
ncbi:M17 family peptidase N-terminal domain-containing protein [Tepidiphilus baoligensis]|uniref:M17 family peptidase N-terminal domain-containing protein n=1 Tax=Tepidiphilus baoligensis TaxID=2698687 RepID=UPI0019D613E6|nr:M17 family peptidase N-terminal domain-containing protein [Tepidiphilus baoligensis]